MTTASTRLMLALAISCAGPHTTAPATDPPMPPATRGEMLQALEDLKSRTPRLPMPADRIAALQAASDRPLVNNALARRLHLPEPVTAILPGGLRGPAFTLPDAFAVELFWITSRSNDCHYCLGHQEAKLERLGVDEARRLALDTDWGGFPDDERAAFAFARKLTLEPHRITDADVGSLITHFGPLGALEVVWLVSRFHATNCWTHAVGIPQEADTPFATTLPADSLARPSIVAPAASRPRPAAPLARRLPSEVAELVFTAALAAQFDRLTESAGLGWSIPPSAGASERDP